MFGGSIQLVRLFGIRVGASPSWFVVLFLFIYLLSGYFERVVDAQGTAYVLAVACALLFFASLVLHELGHALMARRLGIEIVGIDLWFFGGIAKMTQDTTSPGAEFKVAAAGPAVTLVIVALCVGLSLAVAEAGDALDVATFAGDAQASPVLAVLAFLASINAVLFVFNLIPAFPLDGGRLARALVWRLTGDRGKATRIAGRLGQGFALLLIAYGAYRLVLTEDRLDGIYLGVLGWFLFQSARSAVLSTAFAERLEGITVTDIMQDAAVVLRGGTPAIEAVDTPALRQDGWLPVVDDDRRLLGAVRADALDAAVVDGRPHTAVRDLLDGDAGDWRIGADTPVEALLGNERLGRRGALLAVDDDGRLRGVVTADRVRHAVAAAFSGR